MHGCHHNLAVTITPTLEEEMGAAWDRLVDSTPGSDVSQLRAWARLRARAGYRTTYLLVRQGPALLAGAQLFSRNISILGAVGYLPYGPVVRPGIRNRPAVVHALAGALSTLNTQRFRMLFIQPPEGSDDISAATLEAGFRPSDAEVSPPGSIRLDLTAPEDTLRTSLHSKDLRRCAKDDRWVTKGIRVRRGEERDAGILTGLIRKSGDYHGFETYSSSYMAALLRELSAGSHVALFLGEHRGKVVTGHLCTACSDVVTFRLTGFDRSTASPGGVSAIAMWEAIRWAKRAGYRWFDFGGVDGSTLNNLMSGSGDIPSYYRYKLDFGGAPIRYPQAVERVSPPVVRYSYDLARRGSVGTRLMTRASRTLRSGTTRRASADRSRSPGRHC